VRIPDEEEEAARSLLRCRAALIDELIRTRHRTKKFLQTRGCVFRSASSPRSPRPGGGYAAVLDASLLTAGK
jgi:hypothetical protein